ncbi:type II secretion system protein [Succinimonas amylolytica]|uniref:type II secretion system protein n=1 Tax=Succinimonas amylolytica TaxID=83769 RepID=UPI000363ABDA|nr:prepilin-type N-terminal cleavage/methylation domain-containing protein [Succinimonas amylolytica]
MKIKSSHGFTLIELIVVIVILGILAAVAAPKFMDLQSDAKASALKGMEAALKSMDQMVYGKAVLEGKEKLSTGDANAQIIIEGSTIRLHKGQHVQGNVSPSIEALIDADFDNDWFDCPKTNDNLIYTDFYIKDPSIADDGSIWYCSNYEKSHGNCRVAYEQNLTTGDLSIKSFTSGC